MVWGCACEAPCLRRVPAYASLYFSPTPCSRAHFSYCASATAESLIRSLRFTATASAATSSCPSGKSVTATFDFFSRSRRPTLPTWSPAFTLTYVAGTVVLAFALKRWMRPTFSHSMPSTMWSRSGGFSRNVGRPSSRRWPRSSCDAACTASIDTPAAYVTWPCPLDALVT